MALATDPAPPGASWRLATPALRGLRLPATCWEVWNALCDLQAGRERYVWAGALSLAERTGRSERNVYRARLRLEAAGVIERVTTGGTRRGEASAFKLGPVGVAAMTRLNRAGRDAKIVTLNRAGRDASSVTPNNPDGFVTPSSTATKIRRRTATPRPRTTSSVALKDSSSSSPPTNDERKDGPPVTGRPPDRSHRPPANTAGRGGQPQRLGSILGIGPYRDRDDQGAVADLLATEAPSVPDLELEPPKRRRK